MNKKIWLTWAAVFLLSCGFCSRVYMWGTWDEMPVAAVEPACPVIVIDAGHGGMDGGASSASGIVEKDLNLAIAQALEEEASAYSVEIIMTRTEDMGLYTDDDRSVKAKKREDLLRRRDIIEAAQPAIAVSIHMNSFPQDASVCGPQVFYPEAHKERTDVRTGGGNSGEFAESVRKSLEINIPGSPGRPVMTKGDILLFENIQVPVILVECGFLSNGDEAERLNTAEYQQLLARAVWEGLNEILCLEKRQKVSIIDSANTGG